MLEIVPVYSGFDFIIFMPNMFFIKCLLQQGLCIQRGWKFVILPVCIMSVYITGRVSNITVTSKFELFLYIFNYVDVKCYGKCNYYNFTIKQPITKFPCVN